MPNKVDVEVAGVLPVKNTDFKVVIAKDGKKLGTLLVSRGNAEWLPAGNSVNKYRLSWPKFAQLMEENGKLVQVPQ